MDPISLDPTKQTASSLATKTSTPVSEEPIDTSFGKWLNRAIQSVSDAQKEADASAVQLASGENKDIHGTMINMQKAEIAMNLLVEVRNKVISAYEEVKRMQF